MELVNELTFDFTHLPKKPETYEFHLGHEFFAQFEDDEISDGDVDLSLTFVPLAADRLIVSLDYVGEVVVECDRCLLPLVLEMDVLERVDVVMGDSLDDRDDEEITLDAQDPFYDFSWIVYELLALHLPFQRMHEIDDCDPEMVKYLTSEKPDEEGVVEDPLWAELKREINKRKNNNN